MNTGSPTGLCTGPGGLHWVKVLDLPGDKAEQIGAFVAQVRRERGVERVRDLFGRPQDGEG